MNKKKSLESTLQKVDGIKQPSTTDDTSIQKFKQKKENNRR